MSDKLQKEYFKLPAHRYQTGLLLEPKEAQLLELNLMLQILDLPRGSHIIDFGSGNGRVTLFFLKSGYHVSAVDISGDSLAQLKKMYESHRDKSWGKLSTGTTIPDNAGYDAVVGADILHHVEIKSILLRLFKSLKPGGRLVFSEPNACNLLWYIHFLISKIPWQIEKGILQCTDQNLRFVLQKSGFRNTKIAGHGLFPTGFFSGRLSEFNALSWGNYRLFKPICFRLIISANKG